MKKFLSGLIAAFLLSAGFVAVSAETASAACSPSRYVQCQPTATKVAKQKTVKKGKRPKAVVKIKAQAGKPKGTLVITYRGPAGKKAVVQRVKYNGSAKAIAGPKFKKKGVYTVTIRFVPSNNFKAPKPTTYKIRVK